jgi:hypothetical protein
MPDNRFRALGARCDPLTLSFAAHRRLLLLRLKRQQRVSDAITQRRQAPSWNVT